MFQKQWGEFFNGLGDRHPSRMICVGAAGAVTKENGRERSRRNWLPKESFETQLPVWNDDCIGDKGCRLVGSQRHRRQCKQERQCANSQQLSLGIVIGAAVTS
jgi:hypothetical protein